MGLCIQQLPTPVDHYRLDLLSPEFESIVQAALEDSRRAALLRKTAASQVGKPAARMMALANILDPEMTLQIPPTLASSRYQRELRIPTIGALLQLVAEQTRSVCRYDIAKPSWALALAELSGSSPSSYKAKFRADLLRAAESLGFASVSSINGFLMAFLHGEYVSFDDHPPQIHPHFHIVATGDWIKVIEKMRKQRGYAPTEHTKTPIRASRMLHDLPYALSYLMKSYWPAKWRGTVSGAGTKRRTNHHRRIPEPYHSHVLLWLNKYEPSDLILKMGIRQARGGFIMTK